MDIVNHPFYLYLFLQSAHKEALEKTKEKERQNYLVESSSEILAQAEEATNYTGEQHQVSIVLTDYTPMTPIDVTRANRH